MQRFDRSGMTDEQKASQTTDGMIAVGCVLIVGGVVVAAVGASLGAVLLVVGIVLAAVGWRRKDGS